MRQSWLGLGIDILASVEERLHGEQESQPAETATEVLYASGRVEIGRGRLGSGDGSIGAWQSKAVRQYGTLLRQRYGDHDFTTYSGRKAKELGMPRAGVPDELEPTMREHLVKQTSLVTDYEQARDAIANGFPVAVCSGQGFSNRRDNDGFARASGRWSHCMLFSGVNDATRRPGLLCQNSWGTSWNGGLKGEFDIPDGSFWVDADVATSMLRVQDSFAMSAFQGYPKRDTLLDTLLTDFRWN